LAEPSDRRTAGFELSEKLQYVLARITLTESPAWTTMLLELSPSFSVTTRGRALDPVLVELQAPRTNSAVVIPIVSAPARLL
jgi:hypothetical protein